MERRKPTTARPGTGADAAPRTLSAAKAAEAKAPYIHIYHSGAVCSTDKRGYATPDNRNPLELVLDATEGFIPLWEKGTTLRWRFNEMSMMAFVEPDEAKAFFRRLVFDALLLWGDAVPVRFTEVSDAWDFEIVFDVEPKCTPNGCTLARAFFPDSGQHDITIFPTLLDQTAKERIETLAHEFGHVFGLRHFFAQVSESAFPSEIFGRHSKTSIMNYGASSRMTARDRSDLRELYRLAWDGMLSSINGTPVRLVRPFSHMRVPDLPIAIAARMA